MNTESHKLDQSPLVWDNHTCLPLKADSTFLPQLERYRSAGVHVVSVNVGYGTMSWEQHVRVLAYMRRWFALRSSTYKLVATVADVIQCKREGKLGIVFDVEGMCPVADEMGLVQTFYELGVRWMLVAYNRNNSAGGGCLDGDEGLTDVGRAIIDEMERVGMVLCLSHTGQRTAMEALEYARNPVIFSHSNPGGHVQHPRNVSDELIRACARKGGVIGLSGIGPFLGSGANLVEKFVDQMRYIIDLVGPAHVGISLDYVFDKAELGSFETLSSAYFATGISQAGELAMLEPECITEIMDALARDNLTEKDIRGIAGGNWLRVANAVWR